MEDVGGVPVIVERLLEVCPVRTHLAEQLLAQDVPSGDAPALGGSEHGKCRTQIQQSQRLAGEMRVRAVVGREIALDVARVAAQRLERRQQQLVRELRRIGEQLQRPEPGDRAIRHLEAARPVHAESRRVRLDPSRQLCGERARVARVARIRVRLPEGDEVLMAIHLPDELVVAHRRGIEIGDPAPVPERRTRAARGIEMPVDRIAERDSLVAQQVEDAVHRSIGATPRARFRIRPQSAQHGDGCRYVA